MQHLGQILVLLGFGLGTLTTVVALAGAIAGRPNLVKASGRAAQAMMWLTVAISLMLLHAIVVHDFGNKYVASYTDSGMPLFYLLTAFWGGEKGALLFWALILSVLGGALARSRRDDGSAYFGYVNAVVAGALLFFYVVMVWASNPFETFLTFDGPVDGSGLNPLLQNPLMAVHPPFQLAGFVAYTVPFAFAVGALMTGRTDGSWIQDSRRWSLLAWTLLTAGLIIGGLWAYLELGWGGFWGWDPVENAALLPWLAGTAMVHSMTIESRRGMLKRWNLILAFLTFALTIFATFLTRSHLIQSLHSFSNSALTPYFLYYMFALLIGFAVLLAVRWRSLGPRNRIERLWSRETLVVMNNAAFMLALFIVLWGTLLPKISESPAVLATINGIIDAINSVFGTSTLPLTKALDVGPEWFNKVVAPVGLFVLALTAIGPLVPLKSAVGPGVRRNLGWTGLVAGVAAVASGLVFLVSRSSHLADLTGESLPSSMWTYARGMGYVGIYGLLAVGFSAWVFAAIVVDVRRSVRNRRVVTGESRRAATLGLYRANPKRYGGHLVHAGVALTFLGFGGAAGKIVKKDMVMSPLERIQVGSNDLVFVGGHDTWQDDDRYAAASSDVLVWPAGRPVPPDVMEAMRASAPGVVAVEASNPPLVDLRFDGPEAARRFYASAFIRTVGARDFKLVRLDAGRHDLVLAPRQPETLRVVPRSLQRLTEELKGFVKVLGEERATLRTKQGDAVATVHVEDDALFGAVQAGVDADVAAPWLAARVYPEHPDTVVVIAAGPGLLLQPEMRFYIKSENPTTEVDIEPGLLSDLYVASAPGHGSEAVNLTVMQNPLMSGVWAGALVLVLSGFVLVVPVRRRKRHDVP